MFEGIKVDSYESPDSERDLRLNRTLGYAVALADNNSNNVIAEYMLRKIDNLYDYKGQLTVSWNDKPTEQEKDFFKQAWKSVIGDGSELVVHKIS